jgi:hypothetical protein
MDLNSMKQKRTTKRSIFKYSIKGRRAEGRKGEEPPKGHWKFKQKQIHSIVHK